MKKLNQFSRAIVAIVMMLGVSLSTLAHDFYVGGIYYNILDETAKTVQVSFSGSSYSEVAGEYTGDVAIPNSVTYSGITYSVTSIGGGAFRNCDGLTSVTIPNSVTSIGDYAFYGCSGLTEVNITDLSAWGKIDFSGLYSNPLYYANHLKLNGTEITNLVIPNDITEIKKYAFINCDGLTLMSIPNSVTSIGERAFSGCSGLTSVTIPNSVTSIGSSAFRFCKDLTSVTIPNSVTSIGSSAFRDCTGLTSVTIPNSVTSIGDYAFYDCTGLTSVTIGNSVTSIGNSAFRGCTGLTSVNFNATNCTSMGSSSYPVFYKCSKLSTLNIGENVTNIPDYAFRGCDGLTTVNFNAINCTSMGSSSYPVFSGCSNLSTLNIGENVTNIPAYAFRGCSGLNKIISLNPTPPTCASEESFYSNNYTKATLYVPKDSYAKYFIDGVWGKFTNIVKIETLVSSIKLNATSIQLDKGSDYTLSATINPTDATITDILWTSSNPQVATVDQSGKVTALSEGTAIITATIIDGSEVSASCNVTVNNVETKIALSKTEASLPVNEIMTLNYTIVPSTTSVQWSTSDPNIAAIKVNSDNSVSVVGMAAGIATITATANDGSNLSAFCVVTVTDPNASENEGETISAINITEKWLISRTNDKFTSGITKLAANYLRIQTATIYNDYVIFGWSKTMTYAVGDSTASNDFAHLLIYDLSKGTELKEVQLTVNNEPISGMRCANQIGTDDAGNLWFAGYVHDTSKTPISIYKVDDIETGACTQVASLVLPEEEASYFGRMDYCHIIGDITGKTSGAVFMSPMSSQLGATGCWVYRWILPKGGTEWEPGFDDYVCWDTSDLETYPDGQTVWQSCPTVTIVKDEGFEGQNFYIDAMVTAPVLYNTEGGVVDGFMNNEEMAPEVKTNGVAEFAIGNRNFIVYSLDQYTASPGCQVRIAELGEGKSFSGMTGLWDIPEAGLGEVSDGGQRVHSISTHKVYDANGKEGVYLLTYKCNNGVGLYLISEEGFDENSATTPITASSISLDFKSCDIDKGATTTLTATILPENVSDKTVTWSSSDENVATVDTSGKVTGISAGTTTITATTNDGSNLSAFCVVTVTDPNASENEGETISAINITEKWLISRTNDKFTSGITKLAANYSKIQTATIYNDYAIFGWSKTMTYAVGDSTASNDFAHLLIYDLSKGTELKEVQLTVNNEPISGTLCARQIGTDDAGNLWFAGLVFDTSKTAIKVYKVDNIDSGVCSLAAELLLPEEEASYFGRMDYCHIIGDITGETSGAVFMSPMSSQGGATGCWVHRWILPEGGTEWEPGFDGYVCWDTSELETYPAGQTVWNGAPTVTIVKDEGFEGQNFYIDAFVTAPVLYNTKGKVVDGFMNNEEMAPAVGTNGVAEFAIGDRNFIVYSLAQYNVSPGCQVRIAELGEGMSFSGMTGLWDIPTAGLGEVSDGGLRIHSISTHKVYDANGKEGVYLLTYKSNNGVGLYLISEEGFDENPATTPITASSISLDFKSCDLDKGATTTLTATILPENVSDKTVTWSSSDENVATVDTNGKVTGISAGTTTITATTNDGSNLSAFCVVTVNATIVPNVALSSQPVELNLQDTTGSSLIIDMLNENENISAIQFDINLPAGLDIADIDGEYDITLSDRATSSHSVSSAKQADGSIRVIAYSTTSKSFKESEGALFSIKLVGNNIEEGEYLITLSNILMTSPSEVEYHQDSFEIPLVVINYILGDTNGDKLINVTDIVRVANYILGNVPSNFVFAAADVKTDGVINVSDIVGVSNLILNGSASTTSIITQSVKNTSTSSLFLDDFSIAQGETKTIELFVDNTMEFTAMQFDVQMPIGLNFVNAKLTPRATNTHNVITQEQANGNIRLISYSNNNTNYQDNEGAILTIDVKATDNFVGGDIVLKEIILVENNLTETCPTDVVATASIPTGIENVYSHTKIYAEGRNIVVESPLTQIISISTIEGITHMIEVTAGKNVIPTQNAGLYIVTTENQTNKLVIR